MMKFKGIYFVFLWIFSVRGAPKYAVLYAAALNGPPKLVVPIPTGSTCVNLDKYSFDGVVSNVGTEACVLLWDEMGCKGTSLGVDAPDDGGKVGTLFNDLASAVSGCDYPGNRTTTKKKPAKGKGKKVIVVKKKKPIFD